MPDPAREPSVPRIGADFPLVGCEMRHKTTGSAWVVDETANTDLGRKYVIRCLGDPSGQEMTGATINVSRDYLHNESDWMVV